MGNGHPHNVQLRKAPGTEPVAGSTVSASSNDIDVQVTGATRLPQSVDIEVFDAKTKQQKPIRKVSGQDLGQPIQISLDDAGLTPSKVIITLTYDANQGGSGG
jgi:hypothetical protein